jgi:LysM repeat protein
MGMQEANSKTIIRRSSYNRQSINVIALEKAMGLFDFAREIGKKLFGNEAEASEKIKEEIERDNPGINDLNVEYSDGVVSLRGKADSAAAMEKAVLLAGNVKGVAEVKADQLAAPPQTADTEFYVIQKGDTLSAIAKHFYGDANAYPRIFEANREVIKDADLIFPGQKIRIPLPGTQG